jgi:rod shape-determining protein MreD
MIKEIIKTFILFLIIYLWFILESSYLPFLTFLSFLLIFVILINIFEEPQGRIGLFSAFLTGLLMDIYSSHYIGLFAISFFILSLLLKFILSKYVRMGSLSWLPKI